MTHFTVQCAYAAYYSKTVTVEADTLADALVKSVSTANESSTWSSSDYCGNTYVEAVAEGEDVDLWNDERVRPLPIPSRFTEDGEGPHIVVTVEGGVIQHVDIQDGTALVEVHDYDTEGTSEPGTIERDPDGTPYLRGLWTNRIPDPDSNPTPTSTG
jgi:hypothetical protein